jgi:hypothetical protein
LLAIALCVILPGLLALSARGALRPTKIQLAVTRKTPARAAATPTTVRWSYLATHSRCSARSRSSLSYNYPVKPFKQQHRIRGYFGDPRTPLGRKVRYVPGAAGIFNFHNGVDIIAAAHAPVYPVGSGVVARVEADNVIVNTSGGRWFQYYHITPAVQSGQYVTAYKTILGRVFASHLHVHLTEAVGSNAINPLAPGHLGPYRDKTAPVVDGVRFTDSRGQTANPLRLRGIVLITAAAHDIPALPVEGDWPGLGVTPATIAWGLRTAAGRVVIPRRTITDFRRTEPRNESFWKTYAAGTRQNKYGERVLRKVRLVGLFSFNLTPSGLDTRTLPNGAYKLTVRAADTCGNNGSFSAQITIKN